MPGHGPTLFMMPDIELLGIIRVMCDTICNKTTNRTFDMQTKYAPDSQNCKPPRDLEAKPDICRMSEDKTKIPDYLNSSTRKTHMTNYFNSSESKKLTKEQVR